MTGPVGQTGTIAIDERINGDARSVSAFLVETRARLVDVQHPAAGDVTWEVVLAEVLNNVVEHAYRDTDAGQIEIALRFFTEFEATICDRGVAMPGCALPPGAPHDLDAGKDELPEGGFGWNLIHRLTKEMDYTREGDENRLRFTLAFDL